MCDLHSQNTTFRAVSWENVLLIFNGVVFFACCIAGAAFTLLLPEVKGRDPDLVLAEALGSQRANNKEGRTSISVQACPIAFLFRLFSCLLYLGAMQYGLLLASRLHISPGQQSLCVSQMAHSFRHCGWTVGIRLAVASSLETMFSGDNKC